MTQQEVIDLMASSTSENWNDNVSLVRSKHGGDLPDYFYTSIVNSGLCAHIMGPEFAQKHMDKTHNKHDVKRHWR
jgi:hypothetical protein